MGVMRILNPKFGSFGIITNVPEREFLAIRLLEEKGVIWLSPIPWARINAVEPFLLCRDHLLWQRGELSSERQSGCNEGIVCRG